MAFDELSNPLQRAFLSAYAETGIVTEAAHVAGISREAHYDWKAQDEAYADAFRRAGKLAGDALEDVARRRAFEKSDKLLMFLLSALKPDVYGKKVSHSGELTVTQGHIDLRKLTDEELATLARLTDKASAQRTLDHPAGDDSGGNRTPPPPQD